MLPLRCIAICSTIERSTNIHIHQHTHKEIVVLICILWKSDAKHQCISTINWTKWKHVCIKMVKGEYGGESCESCEIKWQNRMMEERVREAFVNVGVEAFIIMQDWNCFHYSCFLCGIFSFLHPYVNEPFSPTSFFVILHRFRRIFLFFLHTCTRFNQFEPV